MSGKAYYAVKEGKKPGIYHDWETCKAQVDGYSGAEYKKFKTLKEAKIYLKDQQDLKSLAPDEETLIAYVDGSYNAISQVFAYGIVLIDHEGVEEYFKEGFSNPDFAVHRNVAGEVMGAVEAINLAISRGKKRIILHYDYEGIEKWALALWKANKKLTQRYQDFFQKAKQIIKVDFVKVLAHSGNKYNDMADKLAKEAAGIS